VKWQGLWKYRQIGKNVVLETMFELGQIPVLKPEENLSLTIK